MIMGQKIIWGADELLVILKQYKKVLLVHGKSFERSMMKTFFDALEHVDFMDFSPNPLYVDVCKGVQLFRQQNCDAIVAVGGGSAIDVAKCVKLFCKMEDETNYLEQEKNDTDVPLIAIPTTAGTGSESTRHAVIYYNGIKQSISHESIVPDYAVLVPELLEGLPVYQKKCTMLDALCQAIESWWSVNSTDESKEYSKQAITLIKDNWEGYIANNAKEAAKAIMMAANFSGRAINITATTAAHAMSYKITSLYHLPHGHAVAVCMPEVWKYAIEHTEECIDPRGAQYFRNTLEEIGELMDLEYFEELFSKLEMTYPEAISQSDDLNILTKSVNPVRLKNFPVSLSEDVLEEMYERIIK
jgi:alcohol dehydrogenase class IV